MRAIRIAQATAGNRPAIVAAIIAALLVALFWGVPPDPAGAQGTPLSDDDSVSSVTVDGTDAYQIRDHQWGIGVSSTTTQVTIVVTPTDIDATVTYTSSDANTSTDGHQSNINTGPNTIAFTVTAENGTDSASYAVMVGRASTSVFGWNTIGSIWSLYGAGNESAVGIWSDGTTIWVSDFLDRKLYAYTLASGERDDAKDFNTLDPAGNDNPRGIWSDGDTMWVADRTATTSCTPTGCRTGPAFRQRTSTPSAPPATADPQGLWSNGEIMWVTDDADDKLYAYQISDGARLPAEDIDTLSEAGNDHAEGIWSDGVTMWVADDVDDKLYAYTLSSGEARR